MINPEKAGQKIQTFFETTAKEVARSTKFVQRESKLSGPLFLQSLVFGFTEDPDATLNILTQVCNEQDVEISEPGLHQRINEKAVKFLKEMFQRSVKLLRNDVPLDSALLKQFTAVYLLDSSTIALPDNLKDEFPGCGGDGPEAALKIQLLFEFLRGNLMCLISQPGRTPDQKFEDHLKILEPGSLLLQDLGYFALASLCYISDQQVYFLSRLNLQTALFRAETEERIDLLRLLSKETRTHFELDLLVGTQERLPCRVLFVRLPEEVVNRRRQKANERARRKGRTLSPRYKKLLAWNIYITNVTVEMLTIRQAVVLYSLRWQIELIFKLWKSQCKLDRVAGLRRERVLCELYAKMIGIVMTHFFMAPLRLTKECELSLVKARQTFQRNVMSLAKAIGQLTQLTQVIEMLCTRILKFGTKNKRKKHPSTCRKLQLVSSHSLAELYPLA